MKVATADYRASQDVLAAFLADCCIEGKFTVKLSSLRKRYTDWCDEHGEKSVSGRRFGEFLAERGFDKRTSNGTWYDGLGLPAN